MKYTLQFGIVALLLVVVIAASSFAMPFGNFQGMSWFGSAHKKTEMRTINQFKGCSQGINAPPPYNNSENKCWRGNETAPPIGFMQFRIGFGVNDTMRQAIENNDYNAYMAAMDEQFTTYITSIKQQYEANKAEMTQVKFSEMVKSQKDMDAQRTNMLASMANIKSALDNNDYAAWKEAIANSTREQNLANVITEQNFGTYVEMQKALENGDFENASQLAQELGLQGPNAMGMAYFRKRP